QLAADGSGVTTYNTGSVPPSSGLTLPFTIPFANGGDGFAYTDLAALRAGVKRTNINLISHYDLTPSTRLTGECVYGHTEGTDPLSAVVSNTVLNFSASGAGAIPVRAANPYLPATAKTAIFNYLSTTFGPGLAGGWMAGAPIPGFQVDLS